MQKQIMSKQIYDADNLIEKCDCDVNGIGLSYGAFKR